MNILLLVPLLVIQDVSVVDVAGGTVEPHRSVVVRGDRIVAAGQAAVVKVPARARVVSGKGKFLMPGLWDMHVHLWYDHQFPLFLANGITGVRDMGSDLQRVNRWRGRVLRPRILTPGPAIIDRDVRPDPNLPMLVVKNADQAREAFDTLSKLNVDFVKILGASRESYFALAERCREWRLPFAGHLPDSVSASEAADARQSSMEHLYGIPSYDPEKSPALFEKLKIFGVRQTPTLLLAKRTAFLGLERITEDPRLRYIDQSVRKGWKDPLADRKRYSEARLAALRREYENALTLVREMNRAGVAILAGTDTGDPYTFPGFELHDELALMVEAGLSPLDALRTATVEPARFLGEEKSMGAVKAGYVADLALLDANPLQDIGNARKLAGLVVAGRYLSRANLARLLAVTAARAKSR